MCKTDPDSAGSNCELFTTTLSDAGCENGTVPPLQDCSSAAWAAGKGGARVAAGHLSRGLGRGMSAQGQHGIRSKAGALRTFSRRS